MDKLILASASPRRQALLSQFHIPFDVVTPDFDESEIDASSPAELARALAHGKARSVSVQFPKSIVIGADTIVVLGDEPLGKPRDEADARRMLRALSGQTHKVITGVAVQKGDGQAVVDHEETAVTFAKLDDDLIERYIRTGEPFDKAGAYAVQGLGSVLISRIEGCYFNVVGLPLRRLAVMLGRFGVNLL